MKKDHKVIAGVVVALGLAGAVYTVRSDEKKEMEAHSDSAAAALPVTKMSKEAAEKVTKLVIKNKDKGEVTLVKKGDSWELLTPVEASANQQNVKSLIDNLQKIELTAKIADVAEVHEKYELDEANSVHVQAFEGDTPVFDWYFGKSGSRGQMVRQGGEGAPPTVYAAKGYSGYLWAREIKNWRANEIAKFEDANVVAAEVENENGKFSFTKDGEDWKAAFYPRDDEGDLGDKKSIEKFDGARVKDMINAYKNLKATDFAGEGDETGVGEPMKSGGVVRITMKDDDGPKYVLKVGNKQEGENRYVAKEGDATVYVITSWAADWATADVSKFQKDEEKEGEESAEAGDEGDTKPAKAGPGKKAPTPPKAPNPPKAPTPKKSAPAAP